MGDIFLWAGIYLGTMLLGYALKRAGVFRKEDRRFLSDLVYFVTLPAMLIGGFGDISVDLWFAVAMALGFGTNVLMVAVGMLVSRKKPADIQALYILNGAGLNLGNITMPYLRNFYPGGIPYMCMFDIGDACLSLGTTNAIATMRLGRRTEGSLVKNIVTSLLKSVPFDTYLIMTVLTLLEIRLPAPVLTTAEFLGAGNGCLAMLLVGLSLEFDLDRSAVGEVLGILGVRYACGAVMALAIWFLLPGPELMRAVLALSVFSPSPSAGLIYSTRLGIRVEIASALMPITTMLMIPVMSVLMVLMG